LRLGQSRLKTTVLTHPARAGGPTATSTSEWYDGKEKWAKNAPADVTLFHELVHARDVTHGTLLPGRSKEGKKEVTNLELGTIGLKVNPLNPFSENQYRKERGLPLRTSYLDPDNQA
jgi:hypothetical protein